MATGAHAGGGSLAQAEEVQETQEQLEVVMKENGVLAQQVATLESVRAGLQWMEAGPLFPRPLLTRPRPVQALEEAQERASKGETAAEEAVASARDVAGRLESAHRELDEVAAEKESAEDRMRDLASRVAGLEDEKAQLEVCARCARAWGGDGALPPPLPSTSTSPSLFRTGGAGARAPDRVAVQGQHQRASGDGGRPAAPCHSGAGVAAGACQTGDTTGTESASAPGSARERVGAGHGAAARGSCRACLHAERRGGHGQGHRVPGAASWCVAAVQGGVGVLPHNPLQRGVGLTPSTLSLPVAGDHRSREESVRSLAQESKEKVEEVLLERDNAQAKEVAARAEIARLLQGQREQAKGAAARTQQEIDAATAPLKEQIQQRDEEIDDLSRSVRGGAGAGHRGGGGGGRTHSPMITRST